MKAHWLIYDGSCGVCRWIARGLKLMDWGGRVQTVDLNRGAESVTRRVPYLGPERMRSAVHLVTPKEHVHAGFFAFRRLSWVLPPLWPTVGVLHLPGAACVGTRLYRWLSHRRHRLGACAGDSCSQ